MSHKTNDGIMEMNDKIEEVILKSVDKLMNKYYRKPVNEYIFKQPECGPQVVDHKTDKDQCQGS